jgi:hypothetical protein
MRTGSLLASESPPTPDGVFALLGATAFVDVLILFASRTDGVQVSLGCILCTNTRRLLDDTVSVWVILSCVRPYRLDRGSPSIKFRDPARSGTRSRIRLTLHQESLHRICQIPCWSRWLCDKRKSTYQIAQDSRWSSRRGNRRIAERCNRCQNAEDGRKDKHKVLRWGR